MNCNQDRTLTFDEKVTGWTSFHSFSPDFMVGMNNRFFSFIGGNLYEHHRDDVARNTYYEEVHPSKLSLMVNDEPSTVKEVKTISMEGNYPWYTSLNAFISTQDNPTMSSIREEEYVIKEGFWYAHARRNENELHLDSRSSYGIGVIDSTSLNILNYQGGSTSLCIGDKLLRGSDLVEIGTIVGYTNSSIELDRNIDPSINPSDFIIGVKNARIEGGNLRGYTIRLDLEILKEEKVELFAVNTDVMKSYS